MMITFRFPNKSIFPLSSMANLPIIYLGATLTRHMVDIDGIRTPQAVPTEGIISRRDLMGKGS